MLRTIANLALPGLTATAAPSLPRIGLALGGGFASAIAHVGVLRVLERAGVRISAVAGISSGAIVAAAFASGVSLDEIAATASSMRFSDVARWSVSKMGLAKSRRMVAFLRRLLRQHRFERMRMPLAIVATDLDSGAPTAFHDTGDVIDPIRASCAYPGLLEPVNINGRLYVDGAIGQEIPVLPLRELGMDQVIAVRLGGGSSRRPSNIFDVVRRCVRIMNEHSQQSWRSRSDVVIEPDVAANRWNEFENAEALIRSGEQAAENALPAIREMLYAGALQHVIVPAALDHFHRHAEQL